MPEVSRKKSPRAPSLTLEDALTRAFLLYEKEHRHEISTEVAALDLGYSGANNGAALSTLASLRYFGLIERPGDGKLVVAKDVETYKFAPEEKTRKQLLKKWVSTPPIFADLLAKYSGGLPSDAAIKFDLIQKGFAPAGADDCLTKFLKSVEFSHFYDSVGDEVPAHQAIAHIDDQGRSPRNQSVTPEKPAHSHSADRIPIRLIGGRRAWLEIPVPFFEGDKERIKAQLDLIITDEEEGLVGELKN